MHSFFCWPKPSLSPSAADGNCCSSASDAGKDNTATDFNFRLVRDSEPLLTADNGLRAYGTRAINKQKNTDPIYVTIRWTWTGEETHIVYVNEAGEEVKGPNCGLDQLKTVLKAVSSNDNWLIHGKWRLGYRSFSEARNEFNIMYFVPVFAEVKEPAVAVDDNRDNEPAAAVDDNGDNEPIVAAADLPAVLNILSNGNAEPFLDVDDSDSDDD
jgi:hypothetical protein